MVKAWSDPGVVGRYISRRTATDNEPDLAVSWSSDEGIGVLYRGAERVCEVSVESGVRANGGDLGPRIKFSFGAKSFSFLVADDAELIQLDNILLQVRAAGHRSGSCRAVFEQLAGSTDLPNTLIRGERVYGRLSELGRWINTVPSSRIRAIDHPEESTVQLVAGEHSVYFSQAEDDSFVFSYPGRPVLAEARMYAPGFDSWAEEFFERILTEAYVLQKRRILGVAVQRIENFESETQQLNSNPFWGLSRTLVLPSGL